MGQRSGHEQDQWRGARKAGAAVAKLAAARKPATRRRSTKVNGQPKHRSSRHAAMTAPPAFQEPLSRQVTRLLLLMRLAATVPTTMPITTAGSARRPNTFKMPAATPDAGQNTVKSEDAETKVRPSRAVRKHAMAKAPAAMSAVIHPRAPAA